MWILLIVLFLVAGIVRGQIDKARAQSAAIESARMLREMNKREAAQGKSRGWTGATK
jgi:hypothetical protein